MVADAGPPTVPISVSRRPSGLTADVERSVLDLVLRTGEAMIATGAPVADVTASLLRLAAGFGVTSCQVDITFISVTGTIERDDDPITMMRVINVRTADYSRLAALLELVDDGGAHRIDLAGARARLDEIVSAPHPYRRWVVTLALGAMAAAVAVLLDGGWLTALVAAATTMLVDRTLRAMRNKGVPYLFQQALGAAIATLVALGLLWSREEFGWADDLLPPSLVVASGIVVLLAGLSLVGAAEDAISGFPLTAAARAFEVVLYTVGIVVGIGFVLDLGQRLGVPLRIGDLSTLSTPIGLQLIAGGVIAGAWALASYTRPRTIAVVVVVGAIAVATYLGFQELALGPSTSSFGAALVVGLLAGGVGPRLTAPSLVVSVCGITPLLPGLAIYSAMFTLVESGDVIRGTALLLGAVGVGLALAAGVTLGEFLSTPLRVDLDTWKRLVRWQARGSRV